MKVCSISFATNGAIINAQISFFIHLAMVWPVTPMWPSRDHYSTVLCAATGRPTFEKRKTKQIHNEGVLMVHVGTYFAKVQPRRCALMCKDQPTGTLRRAGENFMDFF